MWNIRIKKFTKVETNNVHLWEAEVEEEEGGRRRVEKQKSRYHRILPKIGIPTQNSNT